jgi:hypothetical protein
MCDRNKFASVSATRGIASFGSRHQPDPGDSLLRKIKQSAASSLKGQAGRRPTFGRASDAAEQRDDEQHDNER